MKKMRLTIIIGLLILLIGCTTNPITSVKEIIAPLEEPYTQQELSTIYYNCTNTPYCSPNHYFFDHDAYTYGVRVFDMNTAHSTIYGDCEKIMEYEKSRGVYIARFFSCADKRGIQPKPDKEV